MDAKLATKIIVVYQSQKLLILSGQHQEIIFSELGYLGWIGSTNLIECMSLYPGLTWSIIDLHGSPSDDRTDLGWSTGSESTWTPKVDCDPASQPRVPWVLWSLSSLYNGILIHHMQCVNLYIFIRKIFYPDLTTLGCSDPQIKQIACRFPLSALIQAGSTVDQLDYPRFIWSSYALKPFSITLFTLITLCFDGFITVFLIIHIIQFYTHLYIHKFSTLIIIFKKNTCIVPET